MVRTPASHVGNTGSSPVGVTICLRRPVCAAAICIAASLATACVPLPPRPPLWPPDRYTRVLVLPVHMTVSTGAPPFTTPDTDLSDRQGGLAQNALSLVFRARGYQLVNPDDANERMRKDPKLMEAVRMLAAREGFLGEEREFGDVFVPGSAPGKDSRSAVPRTAGEDEARTLGLSFGADLLVIAAGSGEFHDFKESLFTALVSGGRQDTPPSWLRVTVAAVDTATGLTVARLSAGAGWTRDLEDLADQWDRELRIPKKK
jgi:hypothetical protein